MRKLLLVIIFATFPSITFAAGNEAELESVYINLSNKQKLRDGATTFVNNCLSCHGAKYMRFNRLANDLEMTDEQVAENLQFVGDKVGDLMQNTMSKEDAQKWFGVNPPDLSLIARSRKPDWIYTFLKSFYIDESKPTGWNNTVFPSVGMPNVLYQYQGTQAAVYETTTDENGGQHTAFKNFDLVKTGELSEEEYDEKIENLVNFLVYLGEPAILHRKTIGIWVFLFLIVLFIPCYLMKKEFWKDIH